MLLHQDEYLLETERLYLKPCTEKDFEFLLKLDRDPEVRQYFPGGALNLEQVQSKLKAILNSWTEFGYGDFIMIEKSTGHFLGRAGFARVEPSGEIEIGYVFLKEAWGKGYATEAVLGLLKWAKENLPVDRIIAFAPLEHLASQKVLEKVGMTFYKEDLYKGHHDRACEGVQCRFYEYPLRERKP